MRTLHSRPQSFGTHRHSTILHALCLTRLTRHSLAASTTAQAREARPVRHALAQRSHELRHSKRHGVTFRVGGIWWDWVGRALASNFFVLGLRNIKMHGVEVRQLLLCVSPVVAALLFPEPLTWRLRLAASQLWIWKQVSHCTYYCFLLLFIDRNRMLLKSATEFPHHHHPNLIRSGPESCGCNCSFTCTSKFDHPCLTKRGISLVSIVDLDFLNVQLVASCIILYVSSLVKTLVQLPNNLVMHNCITYFHEGVDVQVQRKGCKGPQCYLDIQSDSLQRGQNLNYDIWFWYIVINLWDI